MDLVAGRLAAEEVFPEIAAWLDARDPACGTPPLSPPEAAE